MAILYFRFSKWSSKHFLKMLNSLFIFSEVHYAIQQNRGINAKNRRISISNFKRYQKFRKVHFHVGRKEKAILV